MSKVEKSLSAQEARMRMSYDPLTGDLVIEKHGRCPALNGRVTRSLDVSGYVQVNLKPHGPIKGHRLAWLLHYGEWPTGHIDHINGVRDDNRIANLRVVENRVNAQNKRIPMVTNKSGFLGVTSAFMKADGIPRWRATLAKDKKTYHLGVFNTPEAAHEAYVSAKRQMHAGCTL